MSEKWNDECKRCGHTKDSHKLYDTAKVTTWHGGSPCGGMNDFVSSMPSTEELLAAQLNRVIEVVSKHRVAWSWEDEDDAGFNICSACGAIENDPSEAHLCEVKNNVASDILKELYQIRDEL